MGLHCTERQRRLPLRRLRLHLRRVPRGRHRPQPARSPGASPTSGPTSATSTSRPSTASATCAASGGGRSTAARRRSRSPARSPSRFTVRGRRCTARCSPTSTRLTASVGANAPLPPGRRLPSAAAAYAVALGLDGARARTGPREAVFGFNRAQDWDEFRDAARDFAAPGQNLVYADRRRPHRLPGSRGCPGPASPAAAGDYPAPGWDRRHDWTGEAVPFEALPTVLDPDDGFVVAGQPGRRSEPATATTSATRATTATAASASVDRSSSDGALSRRRT